MKRQKNKGISLVVLMITIIVIVILSTAVILSIANNNLIEKAKEATFLNDMKTIEEDLIMYALDKQFEDYEYDIADINLSGVEMVRELPSTEKYREKIEIVNGKIVLKGNAATKEEIEWANKNNIQIKEKEPVIPNGFVASQATGETEVTTGLVIYEGTEPVTDENVTIARKTRNQFVWVPVEDFSKFERTTTYDGNITVPEDWFSEPYTGASEHEIKEYNAMRESVQKYHGFYIARYEASKGENEKAQFLADKYPWNGYENNSHFNVSEYLDGEPVNYARSVYPVENATKEKDAVSTLPYGVEWDATVSFVEKNYPGISKDSDGKGNFMYIHSTLINTGAPEYPEYAQNNIYDLCGNIVECTMEVMELESPQNVVYRTERGGSFAMSSQYGIAERCLPGDGWSCEGFRVALYLK